MLLNSGEHETLKGSVHAALGLLAGVCAAYNVLAWAKRRETHLAVNAAIYGALVALECRKVAHHLTDTRSASR